MPYLFLCLLFLSHQVHALNEMDIVRRYSLEEISTGKPLNFLGVNSWYLNETMSRQMMVMRNIEGSKKLELIMEEDFFILQIPENENAFTSIALVGFTKSEVLELMNTTSYLKTIFEQLSPFPKAYGQPCGPLNPLLNGIDQMGDFFTTGSGRRVMNCLGPLLQGAWESTGGMVASMARGAAQLVTRPRAFWRGTVAQARNLENFVRNFETKMRELAGALMRLPDEVKATLLCSFAGGIGADALITILTGGAGAIAVIARVDRYLMKVVRLERVLSAISRLGRLDRVSPQFLSSLVTSRNADRAIDEINQFHRHGMTEVVQGAMSCPI